MAIIFDLAQENSTNHFFLEGHGEISINDNKHLTIKTNHIRPNAKATTVWLKNIILPVSFTLDFSFRSNSENSNTMVIFNAQPVGLNNLFDDPRMDARYCDLASHGKMQAYTVGFHRGVYGRLSVLRKIGGDVPTHWGDAEYPTPAWREMDAVTTMRNIKEPLSEADKGSLHHFKLIKKDNKITFSVNGQTIHDYADCMEYPYCVTALHGGYLAFRNFSGPAMDIYESIKIYT